MRHEFCGILFCGDDAAALERTLDSLRAAFGGEGDSTLVLLFEKRRYEIPPSAMHIAEAAREAGARLLFEAKGRDAVHGVLEFARECGCELLFFLRAGDAVGLSFPKRLRLFFAENEETCGLVYAPRLASEEALPAPFRDLPPGSVIRAGEGRELPKSPLGAAVRTEDARAANVGEDENARADGEDGETGEDAFLRLLRGVYAQKISFGLLAEARVTISRSLAAQRNAPKRAFTVSCIVPVYNAELYLAEAVDSVLAQTIGFAEHVQLILVNDGSTDGSGDICRAYLTRHPENVVYVEQENCGVSAARNAGLDIATGEYIAFLDGDDCFEDNYLEAGVEYLRKFGDKIDLVAFPLKLFGTVRNGQEHPLNYKFAKNKLVHLDKDFKFIQMHISSTICRKCSFDGLRFNTSLKYGEDGLLANEIILKKGVYGVSRDSRLNYRKHDDDGFSVIGNALNSVDWYTKLLIFPRKLIELSLAYRGKVTRNTQYALIYTLRWYAIDNIPDDVKEQIDRASILDAIAVSLKYVDDDIILSARELPYGVVLYFLSLKYGKPIPQISATGKPLLDFKHLAELPCNFSVWINRTEERDGNILLMGTYADIFEGNVRLAVRYKGTFYFGETKSNHNKSVSFLGEVIQKYNRFDVNMPFDDGGEAYFFVEIFGIGIFQVSINFTYSSRLQKQNDTFLLGDRSIIFADNEKIVVKALTKANISSALYNLARSLDRDEFAEDAEVLQMYAWLYDGFSRRRIWTFNDRLERADDNAEHFFRYCCAHMNDGIERYYIVSPDSPDFERMKQYGKVLAYGSKEQKLYSLFAELRISSFYDYEMIYPFGTKEQIAIYKGLVRNDWLCLRHGITVHDQSPSLNALICHAKHIVTSNRTECETLRNDKFGFTHDCIILTGLARFDNLYSDPRKQILFVTTWDKTLERSKVPFEKTVYCRRINELFSNKCLLDALSEYGYSLLFKPHSRIYRFAEMFVLNCGIEMAPENTSYQKAFSESALMITDYSSVMFDFAYLKKPIIYWHFRENHYKNGYFDYETMGFGEVLSQTDELVDLIIENIKHGCKMSACHKQRAEAFFEYKDRNNCKRIADCVTA